MLKNRFAFFTIFLALVVASVNAQQTPCPFATTEVDQLARCLLRPVRIYGNLGPAPATLPGPLNALIGQPIDITQEKLRSYLTAHGITEASIGGPLSTPIPMARYFVIHDTSSPYLRNEEFPANINEATWRGNNLTNWARLRVAHLYVNRLGDSATAVNFERPVRATKYEFRGPGRRGRFVHVELIQPRRRDPAGGLNNDAIAPSPGFTSKQLDRLALLYVAASVRRGQWLLPGFHAAIDAGIRDAHDDPQKFDLDVWLASLQTLLTELRQ